MEKAIEIPLFLFGLYILIQIIKKLLSGSWSTEDIIIALLIFNLGCTFTIAIKVVQLSSEHKNLKEQFKCLAADFKEHIGGK